MTIAFVDLTKQLYGGLTTEGQGGLPYK